LMSVWVDCNGDGEPDEDEVGPLPVSTVDTSNYFATNGFDPVFEWDSSF